MTTYLTRHGLRPFFGSHARTSHVQMQVRTHTCALLQPKVVALHTRTPHTFCKLTFFQQFLGFSISKSEQAVLKGHSRESHLRVTLRRIRDILSSTSGRLAIQPYYMQSLFWQLKLNLPTLGHPSVVPSCVAWKSVSLLLRSGLILIIGLLIRIKSKPAIIFLPFTLCCCGQECLPFCL